jgi:hypothetical protein
MGACPGEACICSSECGVFLADLFHHVMVWCWILVVALVACSDGRHGDWDGKMGGGACWQGSRVASRGMGWWGFHLFHFCSTSILPVLTLR